jgi:hypothetical protein
MMGGKSYIFLLIFLILVVFEIIRERDNIDTKSKQFLDGFKFGLLSLLAIVIASILLTIFLRG